jgi:lipopolysaccharide/colanic/teichoic acid biosynthesis glycosyltransferase
MSLVGPRPHALGSKAGGVLFWEAVPEYWARHSVKPGLTGLAQVRGFRGATLTRQALKLRVRSDLEYIQHWSVWVDMVIIVRTIGVLIHRNAF